jgi:hypothetical protein
MEQYDTNIAWKSLHVSKFLKLTTVSKLYRLSALHKFCFHALEVSGVPVNAMKA